MFLSELSDGLEDFEEESWMCRKRCRSGYRLVAPCSCVREYDNDDNGFNDDAVGQSCQSGTDCGMCFRDSRFISFHIPIHAHISKTSCFNVIVILSTGNGRGSQWKCRDGYCEPRSEFEMEMEQVTE